MMEKLNVSAIPDLEFDDGEDIVYKFSDLYQFIQVMGYGGFGIVVAAIDWKQQKKLALKIVDKTDPGTVHHCRMLEYEFSVLKELDHDNIIKIYHLTMYSNYDVMALKLTRESLADFHSRRRKSGKPLTENECALIMRGIFQGLFYLHEEKNIIHRDMKPGNLLIGSYSDLSKVKIIDFGLAV
jgi:serine/threonine protein kinase